ncbi:hypothetical protein Axi01nite_30050 [Actinoplanes xinjiangensis]|nr:hypothetical protein Axi01nite_30050 [Actinoplanes xinjiangensis]
MLTLRAGDLRCPQEVADDQGQAGGGHQDDHPAGPAQHARQCQTGDHDVAENLVEQAPERPVEDRGSGPGPVRRVEQQAGDPVLPDRHERVVQHISERAPGLGEQAGQAASLDQRHHRSEDERGDQQADPQPGQDPQTAVPQETRQREPAAAAGDQEAGDREEAEDADLTEPDLAVADAGAGVVASVAQWQGM